MEPKFKVGDKVKILPRIMHKDDYPGKYLDKMLQYVGTIHTIETVKFRNDKRDYIFAYNGYNYTLKGIDTYIWTSPMLEKVSELQLVFTKKSKKIKLNFD